LRDFIIAQRSPRNENIDFSDGDLVDLGADDFSDGDLVDLGADDFSEFLFASIYTGLLTTFGDP